MVGNGRIAIVTGAGSGIGRASAVALLKAGYSVAIASRGMEGLQGTIDAAGADGERALAVPTDVGKQDQVDNLFAKVVEKFGRRLDVIFNNAGGGTPAVGLEELTFEQYQNCVAVNLFSTFLCTQHAIRIMKDQKPQGGRIINNGSISAHVPRPNSLPYTSCKHAITGMTRSTSLDGRKYNIACSQIDIGNAATPMTDRMVAGVLQADGSTAAEVRMDVQHVADAVVMMANLPLETNIQFMTIMATKMPFVGRG